MNWIMFPPVTLQTVTKSPQRLFDGVPSPSPDQPVVNGSWMQHGEQNNKTLYAAAKLATGGTEKCFENTQSQLPPSCWKPHYSHFTEWETKVERDSDWFSKRASWSYVCAYFSVSTAVLEEMHNSPSGNQLLQHSNKIHQGRIVAYHHTVNSFENPNICDFHKIRQIANQVWKYLEVLTLSCLL